MPFITSNANTNFLRSEFNRVERKYIQRMDSWHDTQDEAIGREADALFAFWFLIGDEMKKRREQESKENPDPLWKAYYQRKK